MRGDHEERLGDQGSIVPAEEPEAKSEDVAEEEDPAQVDGECTDCFCFADEVELVEIADDGAHCDA